MLRRTSILVLTYGLLAAGASRADDYAAKADAALALTKPAAGDVDAARKCARLADEARARGANVLVIAFEGLASFSAASTQQAYRYHWELTHHLPATRPGGSMTGYVVNETLVPLITKLRGSIELLAFPYTVQSTGPGSVPETCALEWMRGRGHHLVVIGHSFGGTSAVRLMEQLEARNVTVDLAATLDPVPITGNPSSVIHVTRNARRWLNFYQRTILPMGVSLPAASVNEQVHAVHIMVPGQPDVVNDLLKFLVPLTQR